MIPHGILFAYPPASGSSAMDVELDLSGLSGGVPLDADGIMIRDGYSEMLTNQAVFLSNASTDPDDGRRATERLDQALRLNPDNDRAARMRLSLTHKPSR